MRNAGVISGVSVSHSLATLDEIESAVGESERHVVEGLLAEPGVQEAYALQTCNRAEAYVVTDTAAEGRQALANFAPDVRDGVVVHMDHEESIRHLMRVAAGLESLVLGEDQILGQVQTAMEEARAVGGLGRLLDDSITKAIQVGKRARSETGINEGSVSLGSAAVELAQTRLALTDTTAVVVGAGEMGTLAARALDSAGVSEVVVANRTIPHAEHVAAELDADASAVGLDATPAALDDADLLISATGAPDHVVGTTDLADAGEILCIDIARPRDIDPAADDIERVSVKDIDALEEVTEATRQRRQREAEEVEAIIDEEFERLLETFKRTRADEAISAMYESAERMKAREVDTALSKLEAQGDLTEEQRETVEALADSLVGQLLAAPTKSLREAAAEDDWTTIQTAMQLFDPEFDIDIPEPAASPGEAPEEIPDDADAPSHVREQLSED